MTTPKIQEKTDQILFVFFSERFNFQDKATILSNLKKIDVLSGAQEIILPIPDDAPNDVPIMFLSKANSYEIRFTRNRIDYLALHPTNFENISSIVGKIYLALQEKLKNIGFVIYSSFDGVREEEINKKLSGLFSDAGKDFSKIETSSEFLLRNLHQQNLIINNNPVNTNLVVMLNSAKKINNEKKMGLDFDINTFPAENINIDFEFIQDFIKQAFVEKDKVVNEFIAKVLT